MESSKTILFYEKCRLCLGEPGACNMFEKGDLARDIYLCTGVQVAPSDNLPQKICNKCLDIVSKAKSLRLLATKNDSHLRSLFDDDDDDDERDRLIIEEPAAAEDIPSCSNVCDKDNKIEHKKDNLRNSAKSSLDTKNQSNETVKPKTISVRNDLFKPTTVVRSSTKVKKKKEEYDPDGQRKRIKWEPDSVEYQCDECKKQFETWKKLYMHLRLHNKTIACPLDACGKMFATKGDLEKHVRTHTGVKPYQCHICDRRFTQQVTLKSHKESVHYRFDTVK